MSDHLLHIVLLNSKVETVLVFLLFLASFVCIANSAKIEITAKYKFFTAPIMNP